MSDRDSYTNVQQRKRIRSNKPQDGTMSDRQCTSLLPSSSDNVKDMKQTRPVSPWQGWKSLSNESSPNCAEKNHEFPPLVKDDNLFDSWFTPEPIKNWADFMDEEESQENVKPTNVNKKQRFKRKLLLSDNGDKPLNEQKPPQPILTDEHRLSQRQKQLDYGKNTMAYGRYITETPRHCRQVRDPRTPDKFQICSTRSWTGQVKSWRRRLHEWDPPTEGKVNLFAHPTKSNASEDDVQLQASMDAENCGSPTSSNSSEDFFKELNIDACLLSERLPL